MTDDDIFDHTKGAYLCLIHPVRHDGTAARRLRPWCACTISALRVGCVDDYRRVLARAPSGVCMAMAAQPASFVEPMLQSLRDPRVISIVPACAALAVLARRGVFAMPQTFSEMFDRQVFDGEIGWATDKAMHFAGLRAGDVSGRGRTTDRFSMTIFRLQFDTRGLRMNGFFKKTVQICHPVHHYTSVGMLTIDCRRFCPFRFAAPLPARLPAAVAELAVVLPRSPCNDRF